MWIFWNEWQCHDKMQYTTLGRERKGSVTSTTHNVASWFSSLKRTKKGRNHKTEATSKSAWDLTTLSAVRALVRPCFSLLGVVRLNTCRSHLNYSFCLIFETAAFLHALSVYRNWMKGISSHSLCMFVLWRVPSQAPHESLTEDVLGTNCTYVDTM